MKYLKEFIMRKIAGESILVPVGKTAQDFNGMVTLSPTAQVIWDNLEKVDSFDEMVSIITDEFEIDEETAKRDTYLFVNELLKNGFIATTKEDESW